MSRPCAAPISPGELVGTWEVTTKVSLSTCDEHKEGDVLASQWQFSLAPGGPLAGTEPDPGREEAEGAAQVARLPPDPRGLLRALDPRRPIFAAALYTGLRKGELLALRKSDVDLPR